jgi:hypothetical protein
VADLIAGLFHIRSMLRGTAHILYRLDEAGSRTFFVEAEQPFRPPEPLKVESTRNG